MLSDFTSWLLGVISQGWVDLWSFVGDAAVAVFGAVVTAISTVFAAIPVPAWMSSGLGAVYSGLDPGVAFFLSQFGLPQALAIIGLGYAFKLARKAATLFLW